MPESYDVVVVGAGSSGSVIARRLVDAGARVMLVEAGGPDQNPAIHDLPRMGELWHSAEDWDYYTVPQDQAGQRRLHLPRGRVLGGSHALNAAIWVRGAPQDFDAWAAAGNHGWAWSEVLPVYRRIERYGGAPSKLRGTEGLLDVVPNEPLHPIQQSIISAAVEVGLEHNLDYNGDHQDGISQQQVTMRDRRRLTTWRAYAAPVAESPNLTVRTGTWVRRVLVDGAHAVGVEFESGEGLQRAYGEEVVLAAGTIDSPCILLRSGIGPAAQVRNLGVDVVADLPGVGENLHDHLLSPVIFTTDAREIEPPVAGRSVTQTHLFWRSRSGLDVPDTQPICFSVPMYEPWMTGPESGFSLMAGMVTPKSRGRLRLSGDGRQPHIDLNALAEKADVQSLVASVQQCRAIGRASPLATEWGAREIYPGPDVDDEQGVREYVRRTAITYHHQVGTCRMGIDDMAVVDPTLAVHGIRGLRVADASVMPQVTTGNTNAPSVLIGERAAEFLTRTE